MRRRISTLKRSLGMRLLVVLLLSIGVVLAAYSIINFHASRNEFLAFVNVATERSSDLIRRGTRDAMLLNRLDRVQETLGDIAASPDVAAVRVYDKNGVIVLSAQREEIGQRIGLDSDTCESCHLKDHTMDTGRLSRSGLVDIGGEVEVLRHLAVIENEPSCSATGCHPSPSEHRVLGVLDVEMSIAPVERTLEATQWRTLWTTAALFLIVIVVMALFVNRVVHKPVAELVEGTRRVAKGELDTRLTVRGRNELSRLAEAFNQMAGDLEVARREITDWSERLEQKVIEKTDELQRAQRQVLHMEKMASIGKLSATVAHELNNPINAMLTYTRLVQRELAGQPLGDATKEELGRYLDLLQKECSRCGDIVRNLLAFARRSGAEMAPVDVNDIVERSLMLIQHHLEISGITLHSRLLERNSQIVADAGQLQQALVALLVNAVEAMVGPETDPRELTVRLNGDADRVRIQVTDTGTGIDPDVLPHVFEPFFSTKHKESGVGLGLSVVYGIVQRHGGTIEIDSKPGLGTTFRVALPRRPPRPSDEAAASQDATPSLSGEQSDE
ncbi:MAG: HAMP domain-containing protein [Acidobacteriota bacterium]|nr:MAG: HAMP domain-containing protein [Acidobacteriota bacterium]